MLEMIMGGGSVTGVKLPTIKGPGSQELQAWYIDPNDNSKVTGYFGDIAAMSFIPSYHLASLATDGGSLGIINTDVVRWLKVYIDGKILFIPQKPLANAVSYDQLYQARLIYGTNTTGTTLTSVSPKVIQYREITYDGFRYSIRLLKGMPAENTTINNLSNHDVYTRDSEWNRLMYNLCDTPDAALYRQGPLYKALRMGDLMISTGYMELVANTLRYNNDTYPVVRFTNSNISGLSYFIDVKYVENTFCWRPVLEFLGPV